MSDLTRREFYGAAGSALAAAALASPFGALSQALRAAEEKGQRLNILWLMTDQHTHSVMGCAGNLVAKTPNMDALAAAGVRFAQATCVTPFCSPTRASFISGRYPHSHGVTGNISEEKTGVKDPYVCTEDIMFDRGFATSHLGKWHLGIQRELRCYKDAETKTESHARHQKEVLGPLGEKALDAGPRPGEVRQGMRFVTEAIAAMKKEKGRKARRADPKGKQAKGAKAAVDAGDEEEGGQEGGVEVGRSAIKPEYSYESWLTDQCIALLEKNKDHNFMITLSLSPPHAPWFCPAPYYDMYKPSEMPWPASANDHPAAYQKDRAAVLGRAMGEANLREFLRCYYGLVSMTDAMFGRVLEAVKRLGLEENTLVVYTSDHGDLQTAHGFVGKVVPGFFEEILRVPLILRYPPKIKPGAVLDCCAQSVDLMPTLLDYASAPIPGGVQGHSLRPFIEGEKPDADDAAFCERGLGDKGNFGRMARTVEAKYCFYGSGQRELFDLKKDPYEMKNVADDPAYKALRDKMHARLLRHAQETGDPAAARMPKQ